MYQIDGRSATLSLNNSDKDFINADILQFQELVGQDFASFKELFKALLSNALENADFNKHAPKHEEYETLVTLPISHGERAAFIQKLNACTDNADGLTLANIELLIAKSLQTPQTVEVEKIVERDLSESEMLLQFNEKELMILKAVANNRYKAGKANPQETLPELTKKMILNDNVLFDLGGEFYTGLRSSYVKKIGENEG